MGQGVAVENCGGALSASSFMSMVRVSALGGVRGRPAYHMKAKILSFHLLGSKYTYSYVLILYDTLKVIS